MGEPQVQAAHIFNERQEHYPGPEGRARLQYVQFWARSRRIIQAMHCERVPVTSALIKHLGV